MQADLFDSSPQKYPLAYRQRPSSWNHFIGQPQITKRLQSLSREKLRHLIFWGPPGSGKTTLAHLIANELKITIYPFNAVLGGVPELRKIIKSILDLKKYQDEQSVVFIDEIHRFNKAQQDALLPYLEREDFILFGATTEYPQTTLNRAILSRVNIVTLEKLSSNDLVTILENAMKEEQKEVNKEIINYLARYSNGDARFALNKFEQLLEKEDFNSLEVLKELLNRESRQYDKNSDRHYDVISAFIKSIRGSDANAAILWLAVMLDGGEDIEFIARRLIILASEDIGNADPQALQIATSTHYAIKTIGMPEARIILAQAVEYLAKARKGNRSYMAINKALEYVRTEPTVEVPTHLRNHHPDKKNYKYPHNYPKHWVKQDYGAPEKFLD